MISVGTMSWTYCHHKYLFRCLKTTQTRHKIYLRGRKCNCEQSYFQYNKQVHPLLKKLFSPFVSVNQKLQYKTYWMELLKVYTTSHCIDCGWCCILWQWDLEVLMKPLKRVKFGLNVIFISYYTPLHTLPGK